MAVIVESPAIDAPCTEMWADPSDVWEALGQPTISEADVIEATIEATYMLWSLSGYKYHGWQTWQEDYLLSPQQTEFFLAKYPVDEIISIVKLDSTDISGGTTELNDWTYDGRHVFLGSCTSPFITGPCYPCNGTTRVRVTYRIKPYLAPGAARVTAYLTRELSKAKVGLSCALPDRITAITRQGISWTVLDPQDFLLLGRTGMGQVDGWLAMVNRLGITRTIDTYYAPVVVHSVLLSCEAP